MTNTAVPTQRTANPVAALARGARAVAGWWRRRRQEPEVYPGLNQVDVEHLAVSMGIVMPDPLDDDWLLSGEAVRLERAIVAENKRRGVRKP